MRLDGRRVRWGGPASRGWRDCPAGPNGAAVAAAVPRPAARPAPGMGRRWLVMVDAPWGRGHGSAVRGRRSRWRQDGGRGRSSPAADMRRPGEGHRPWSGAFSRGLGDSLRGGGPEGPAGVAPCREADLPAFAEVGCPRASRFSPGRRLSPLSGDRRTGGTWLCRAYLPPPVGPGSGLWGDEGILASPRVKKG